MNAKDLCHAIADGVPKEAAGAFEVAIICADKESGFVHVVSSVVDGDVLDSLLDHAIRYRIRGAAPERAS